MKKYVDVILPLPLSNLYTYSLAEEMQEDVDVGFRVVVPFGKKKYYTAIVAKVHYDKPQEYEVKEVSEVLDNHPIILADQLELWRWIASYYLCTLGDVYKAAIPSGLKIESETVIVYNKEFEASSPLSDKEQKVLDILESDNELCINQLEKYSGIKNILRIVNHLLDKEAVFIKEELKNNYKPKVEARVRLVDSNIDEDRLNVIFDSLSRAQKQQSMLMKFIELSQWFSDKNLQKEVSKAELIQKSGFSAAIFRELEKKNILETYFHEIGRISDSKIELSEVNTLNDFQVYAYNSIIDSFNKRDVCLLHGVTSSGKTEIYINLIHKVLQAGKQVLYLLPEIALTTQITERLKKVFGDRLGIYHSKFSDAERVEIWQKQLTEKQYDVILGVRSSIFLPFTNLGLVIIDEEHENSYKQQDPAPRYHARSAAIMLASRFRSKVLLGTATPSVESYYNALTGKYALVELNERYKDLELPHIELVDIKELARKKMMTGPFSPILIKNIREALERKEQVILFQNRRGFAPIIECSVCGWVPKCKNCDVSLTYHKNRSMLTCHYCGYTYQMPTVCPACGNVDLKNRGYGTERIEDDVEKLFPEAKVARMDLDTTRTRNSYENIISDFENGNIDILIGTQMISKGLDFDNVSIVGILNADTLLNYPDFRSYERAFQLMAQVAGRAGRKYKRGLVILQTKSAEVPVISQVINNDYQGMYNDQIEEREAFKYPPFYKLICVYVKHRNEDVTVRAAETIAGILRTGLGNRILGPDKPAVARVQNLFIRKILVKIDNSISIAKVRDYLVSVQKSIVADEAFRSVTIYYDVDPM